MERMQSTWENLVDYNLSESGVHPLTPRELLEDDADALLDQPLVYTQSNGTLELRSLVAALYPGVLRRSRPGHQRRLRSQLHRAVAPGRAGR